MANKVEIQVEVVGAAAAKAQLSALTSPSTAGSAAASPATAGAAAAAVSTTTQAMKRQADAAAIAAKSITSLIDTSEAMTAAQARSSAPMLEAAKAMKAQQSAAAEAANGMSALEQAQMATAGVLGTTVPTAAGKATSALGSLLEKIKQGTTLSGNFMGAFTGMLASKGVEMAFSALRENWAKLKEEMARGTAAEKDNQEKGTFEYQQKFAGEVKERQRASLLTLGQEKSAEEVVADRWAKEAATGGAGSKASRRLANMGGASKDEYLAEVKAETERRDLEKQQADRAYVSPAQRAAILDDLQKRMDDELVKNGKGSEEYQRLSGLYTAADQGQLAGKYQGKNLADQVALEDTRSRSELEKAKSHADIEESLNQQLAAAKAGRDFKGTSQASELLKALGSGELAKLGGEGGEAKGLEKQKAIIDARFKEQEATLALRKEILQATKQDKELAILELKEKMQELALKGASRADLEKVAKVGLARINGTDKIEEIQRPASMVRGSQEAFSAQLGPVMQDPIKATQENTKTMRDLKDAIDRALQGGTIVVVGRNA